MFPVFRGGGAKLGRRLAPVDREADPRHDPPDRMIPVHDVVV